MLVVSMFYDMCELRELRNEGALPLLLCVLGLRPACGQSCLSARWVAKPLTDPKAERFHCE